MSVLSTFGNYLSRKFGAKVPGNPGPYNPFWVGTTQVYPTIGQQEALINGFNGNAAVYSIVNKYSDKAASIERYLETLETEEPFPDSHPLMKLLKRPNNDQSQSAFFGDVFCDFKLFGEAFIWLNRGDDLGVTADGQLFELDSRDYIARPVLEMFCVPANQMGVIPDPDNLFGASGYYFINRPDIKFRKEDFIHWKGRNRNFDQFGRPQVRGMSPLTPAYKILAADNSATDSMVRMFQNDGAKGVLYNENMAPMNPEQKSQLERVMRDKVNSKEVKNTVAAFQGKWGYHALGLTSVDMETIAGKQYIMKELCWLFSVPFALFDTEITYANQNEAQKSWVGNTIKPDCKALDGELQRVLFLAFNVSDEKARICSNFDDLPEMQEDKAKQVEWLMKAPLTPNEVRDALGYEVAEKDETEADKIYIPSGYVPMEPQEDPMMYDDILNQQRANGAGNTQNSNGQASQNGQRAAVRY